MSNLDLVRKGLQAFAAGDGATLSNTLTDDMVFSGVTPMPLGKQEFLGFMQAITTAMPDFKFVETAASENGDTVVVSNKISGTHTGPLNVPGLPSVPATGKKVDLPPEKQTYTIRDGKVAKLSIEPAPGGGLMGMLQQIGVQMPG